MMVKVLTCAYATGTFSPRRIARKLEDDVTLRMLAADSFPQRRTACGFRRRHLEDFRALFVEAVRVARSMGLARFGALSVDGTKVRANASKRKAMSYERMKEEEARLEREIGELLAAVRSAEDDALHGESVRGDETPEALRGRDGRLAATRDAKARLDAEAREAPPRPKTKPDAAPAPAAREAEPPRQEMKADAAPEDINTGQGPSSPARRPPNALSKPPEMPFYSLSNWTCFRGRVRAGQGFLQNETTWCRATIAARCRQRPCHLVLREQSCRLHQTPSKACRISYAHQDSQRTLLRHFSRGHHREQFLHPQSSKCL